MSWMQKLYATYNNCEGLIGVDVEERGISLMPLLPIAHTTQKAQIELIIDGDGNFKAATVVPKSDDRTIIPCTEKSAGRTSGEAPHPLSDKLQYVAIDYVKFGGSKKPYFNSYITQLEEWCKSEFAHPKAIAVLKYVKKGTVVKDLVNFQVLIPDEKGMLLSKWDKKKDGNVPKIFQIPNLNQEDAFIRWVVEIEGNLEAKTWRDQELWDGWIQYYISIKKQKSLCYVTGEAKLISEQHPAKIQNDADKAKLISSNDWSEFTFRGRFTDSKKDNTFQTYSVGFDVTQKAHSALRWLIGRQGYRKDGLSIVAWAISGVETPQPTDDGLDMFGVEDDSVPLSDTQQDLAIRLRNTVAGYRQKTDPNEDVIVIALDSVTPGQGRMSIAYYRELKSSDFLERLESWHETCSWLHTYRFVKDQRIPFIGAPAPKDIALAAYGTNRKREGKSGEFKADDNLVKTTANRILPCIIDGQPIPRDIVESAVRKASNRIALEDWQWEKTLSIACALYKKHKEGKEKYDMALDETRNTRDYLYGRLLAIADRLEEHALYKAETGRATNATRYMQQFSQHPYRTWEQLHSALIPYMVRLDGASYYKNKIAEVKSLFNAEDFTNDKPLSGEYLLGYYSQRQKFFERATDDSNTDDSETN